MIKINSLRSLMLLDAVGAGISLILSGLVLPLFHEKLGIPLVVFYSFATLALFFLSYSLISVFLIKVIRPLSLKWLVFFNLLYLFFSLLVMLNLKSMTLIGWAVLILEWFTVAAVVIFEIHSLNRIKFSADA